MKASGVAALENVHEGSVLPLFPSSQFDVEFQAPRNFALVSVSQLSPSNHGSHIQEPVYSSHVPLAPQSTSSHGSLQANKKAVIENNKINRRISFIFCFKLSSKVDIYPLQKKLLYPKSMLTKAN